MKSSKKTNILMTAALALLIAAPLTSDAKESCACCSKPANSVAGNPRVDAILASFQSSPRLLAESGGEPLPEETVKVLDALVAIQVSLADDSMEHVGHHAAGIAAAAREHQVHGLTTKTADHAEALSKARDIKTARAVFKKLNESMEAFLKEHRDSTGKYRIAYCPMAKASWVQSGPVIANPYFGKSMLKCGSFKS